MPEKIKNKPVEVMPGIKIKIPTKLIGVEMNKKGIKELLELLEFLLLLGKGVKVSLEDGVITILDATNFTTLIFKIAPAFSGIELIGGELSDTITDEEKAQIKELFLKTELFDDQVVEEAITEAIDILVALKNWIFKYIVKSSLPIDGE